VRERGGVEEEEEEKVEEKKSDGNRKRGSCENVRQSDEKGRDGICRKKVRESRRMCRRRELLRNKRWRNVGQRGIEEVRREEEVKSDPIEREGAPEGATPERTSGWKSGNLGYMWNKMQWKW